MKRGEIYILKQLKKKKRNDVDRIMNDKRIDNQILIEDTVLVDMLNGDINIKFFRKEKVDKMIEETGKSEYNICMDFIRLQNK